MLEWGLTRSYCANKPDISRHDIEYRSVNHQNDAAEMVMCHDAPIIFQQHDSFPMLSLVWVATIVKKSKKFASRSPYSNQSYKGILSGSSHASGVRRNSKRFFKSWRLSGRSWTWWHAPGHPGRGLQSLQQLVQGGVPLVMGWLMNPTKHNQHMQTPSAHPFS